jgi:Uma2 family endonuclease
MPGSEGMKSACPGVRLTYDDYVQFPEDGKRHELIDGEHVVTPTPNRKHQAVSANLLGLIWSYLQQHPIGRVFSAPFDVILSDFDVVEPDLLYISQRRLGEIVSSPWIRGAPTLVVEIGSPATRKRDATVKRRLYERFGVDEYWIVDPEADTIDAYRRVEGRYERASRLTRAQGDVLTTPLLPRLELPLVKIFED